MTITVRRLGASAARSQLVVEFAEHEDGHEAADSGSAPRVMHRAITLQREALEMVRRAPEGVVLSE